MQNLAIVCFNLTFNKCVLKITSNGVFKLRFKMYNVDHPYLDLYPSFFLFIPWQHVTCINCTGD